MSYLEDRLEEIRTTPKMKPDAGYKNIETGKNRHGKTVSYFRVGKGKRTRLPDRAQVGEALFKKAYIAASGSNSEPWAQENTVRAPAPKSVPPVGKPGYTYFARSGSNVKIGFSTNISSRMKSIQTSSADPIEILMVIPGSDGTETFFHQRFADYRVGGEWFRLTGILAEFLGVKL